MENPLIECQRMLYVGLWWDYVEKDGWLRCHSEYVYYAILAISPDGFWSPGFIRDGGIEVFN